MRRDPRKRNYVKISHKRKAEMAWITKSKRMALENTNLKKKLRIIALKRIRNKKL
jgi:hypothetical protein